MGVAERRIRDRAELRERILEAARRIVFEDGFAALSMRKIADAIEYSAGTIYLHFESRDAIALQLVSEGFAELISFLEPAAAIADPLERCFAIGSAYVRFGLERPQSYRLIFMENPRFSDALVLDRTNLDEPGGQAFQVLLGSVQEAAKSGAIGNLAPENVADLMWAGLHGIVSLKIACPSMMPSAPEPLVALMMSALAAGFAVVGSADASAL